MLFMIMASSTNTEMPEMSLGVFSSPKVHCFLALFFFNSMDSVLILLYWSWHRTSERASEVVNRGHPLPEGPRDSSQSHLLM